MKLLNKFLIFIITLFFAFTINVSASEVAFPSEKIKIKEELFTNYQVSYRLLEKEQIILFKDKANINNYSLAFKNEIIEDYYLDYYLSFDKFAVEKKYYTDKMKYITFVPEKDLETTVKVTISVKELFKDGTKVEIYRIKNDIEKIGKTIKVEDGYITFNVESGSRFFIRKEIKYPVLELVKFMNMIIIWLIIISIILILKSLIFVKK